MWSQTSCSPKQRHEKTGSLWPGFRKKTTPGRSPFCAAASSNRLDNHKGCRGFPALRENGGQVWSATGRAVREAEWAHCCRARSPFGVFPCIRIKRDAFPVQAVAPQNFERKSKKAVLQAICLQDRFLRFMRQKFGASPPFSYVTPAFPASFFIPACTLQVLSGGKSFSLHPLCVIIIRYVRKTRERET